MKTIAQGNLEALKEYKYFECKTCGWIGKAEKVNMNIAEISVKETVGEAIVLAVSIECFLLKIDIGLNK